MIKYRMNLVKSLRAAEKRSLKHRVSLFFLLIICFSVLGGSGYYSYSQVTAMQRVINREKEAVRRLEAEYRNYQSTQSTVDKADVELLNDLLSRRVYWTRVLDAMAKHLPDEQPISYWITRFGYRDQNRTFTVQGYGYITQEQEQLLALDEYLNKLRADSYYSDVFGSTALRSATRSDEVDQGTGGRGAATLRERVNFEYASVRKGGARR